MKQALQLPMLWEKEPTQSFHRLLRISRLSRTRWNLKVSERATFVMVLLSLDTFLGLKNNSIKGLKLMKVRDLIS